MATTVWVFSSCVPQGDDDEREDDAVDRAEHAEGDADHLVVLAAREVREAAAGGEAAEDGEGDEAADEDEAEREGTEVVERPEGHALFNGFRGRRARPVDRA
ncbi:hypothetical protein [Streptomyces goshikiensis]|uniref:hypothetical protein n=1 Tax=Streptomyces goshikiensis TaxID=1942 RepID=UPI00386B8DD9